MSTPGSPPRPRLLAVDDEPDMLDFLERVFRGEYEVVRAAGAAAALAALAAGRFDVLVTDHRMPGMSGVELLARAGGSAPPVRIVLTGDAEEAPVARAVRDLGACAVPKPVDSARLRAVVASLRKQ